jgi:hypothetical protein
MNRRQPVPPHIRQSEEFTDFLLFASGGLLYALCIVSVPFRKRGISSDGAAYDPRRYFF